MDKLKKVSIQLTKKIDGLSFVDKSIGLQFVNDKEILLFFSNIEQSQNLLSNIMHCFEDNNNHFSNIESYLLHITNSLIPICGETNAQIIMMDTVNKYITSPKKFKSIEQTKQGLIKALGTVIMMAESYANLAATITERSEEKGENFRFLYALAFEYFGGMNGQVTYGVYPAHLNGELFFCDIYTITSAEACLMFDLATIAKENGKIKRCANCGKYFSPFIRSDEIYCSNLFLNTGKTCKDVGYTNKIRADSFLSEYRKVYKTKNAFKNRNIKNNPHAKSDFDIWVKEAKQNLIKAQSGEISLDEFKKLLKGEKESEKNGR